MPGPLSMADNVLASSPKKAMTSAHAPERPPSDPLLSNGTPFEPPSLPRQNESSIRSSLHDLPPELRHWTEDYQPLNKLIGRVTQGAFNDLNDLLSDFSKLPEVPQLNGSQQHPDTATVSAAGAQRRLKWLNFANKQRQRFMRLLVISQWTRRIHDIEKLVDINLWLSEQYEYFNRSQTELAELRRNMANARIPSPDIDTALEVLETGKSSRAGHLGYIPLEPLPAAKVLKTLKSLNVLLHVRLNLHEDLPERFKDYTIHSGRVTFKVPWEFEVDLSIADEEKATQFWFVDFRLAFSPLAQSPAAQLRGSIEQHVNAILAGEGLAGCYDFLHEFALTHKINILRRQALDLSRGAWAGSLRIEHMHRCLVVQYWANRPGRKSWIQIGVRQSIKSATAQYTGDNYSRLFVKCMQNGKDTHGLDFTVPDNELDMESILRKAISQHVSATLSSLETRYATATNTINPFADSTSLDIRLDPTSHILRLPLTVSREASVTIEPISGDFLMQPITSVGERYQSILNSSKDPVDEPFVVLERWRAAEVQSQFETLAANSGFRSTSIPGINVEVVKKAFGHEVVRASFFSRKTWAKSDWYLGVSIQPFLQRWWVVKITSTERGVEIVSKEPMLDLAEYFGRPRYPKHPPADIERLALARISLNALSLDLRQRKIPSSAEIRVYRSNTDVAVIKFNAQALLDPGASPGRSLTASSTAFADGNVNLFIHGFEETRSEDEIPLMKYTIKGHLDRSKVRPNLLSQLEGPDLTVDSVGRFALNIRSRLGSADAISQLSARLHSLQRLSFFLIVLGKHRMPSQSVTESQITFRYSKDPGLTATITFGSIASNQVALVLGPRNANPQQRLLRYLNDALNSSVDKDPGAAFEQFFRVLGLTLPALEAFDKMESVDPSASRVRVHARSETSYSIEYPRVGRAFRMILTSKRGEPIWTLAQAQAPRGSEFSNQGVVEARLKDLFSRSGDGWTGRMDGITAERQGIRAAIEQIDKTMTECEALVKSSAQSKPLQAAKQVGGRGRPQAQLPNGQANQKKNQPANQKAKGPAQQTQQQQQQPQAQQQKQQQPQRGPNGTAKPSNSDVVVLD